MRILHTADWHVGELNGPVADGKNARLMDTLACADYLVQQAQREKPDVILISGDLFDKSKLWSDTMLNLISAVAVRLRLLAEVAPTILMFGTANHDSRQAFENISFMMIPNLIIISTPQLLTVGTAAGPLQVGAVPGLDKGYFRTKLPGMSPEQENQVCSQMLEEIVTGLSVQLDEHVPSVLMAHYTVVGCELDNGQHVFSQSDVVLPREALEASDFDLVCLGHIHRIQQIEHMRKPVFYSGAINGLTFNEEGQDKGFWLHNIEVESIYHTYRGSQFIETPSRELITLEVDLTNSTSLQDDLRRYLSGSDITGVIARLHYSCSEEQRKQLVHKEMEKLLYTGGAFHVSEIRPKQVIASLVKQEMTETAGPLDNLAAWASAEGFNANETQALIELAKPFLATVSAKMPTGSLNGVFEPKRLEVSNYRSYINESIDFQKIFFATVNGPNGIGKSAFFMDAICDCLYEQPRSGETGSWITKGQNDGSIIFEFGMGSTNWRVVRSRSLKGSGKITLSLQELVNGRWENRSADKARDTQEKIEGLLGMDCATFLCTALIMQDAYGVFMDADKEKRMEVLANILGLNVYESLTDLAKARVTELNRTLNSAKDQLAILDEKLKKWPELEAESAKVKFELEALTGEIQSKEAELVDADGLVALLTAKADKAKDLDEQIVEISGDILTKQNERNTYQSKINRAQQMFDSEKQILAKAQEYEQVKERVTVLKTKQPRVFELKTEQRRLLTQLEQIDKSIERTMVQIGDLNNLLSHRPELEKAVAQYQEALTQLQAIEEVANKYDGVTEQIRLLERDTNRLGEEIRDRTLRLDDLRNKANMLERSNCIDSDNAKCAFLADAQRAKAQISQVQQELSEIISKRDPLLEQFNALEDERQGLNYSHKEHVQLKQLVNNLRPKAEQATQLTAKVELLENLKSQLAEAQERREPVATRLVEVDSESADLEKELRVLPGLVERLPKLEAWVKAKDELPAAREVITSAKDVMAGIEADISFKGDTVTRLEQERQELLNEVCGKGSAESKATNLRDLIRGLRNKQNELHATAGAIKGRLESLAKDETERQRIQTEMDPMARDLVRYQNLARAFGFDGIPFRIVRSVVPELSTTANGILGQMTGGQMSLEMKTERVQKSNKKEVNALEVWITDWRGNIPYKDRSGGQKVKAALANAFALADLKARRVGIQLGMMFIDEPPFLDAEGIDAYCDALEMLSTRYPNMRVIAISHDPRMKARFPQQIEVVDMGEAGSKVQVA